MVIDQTNKQTVVESLEAEKALDDLQKKCIERLEEEFRDIGLKFSSVEKSSDTLLYFGLYFNRNLIFRWDSPNRYFEIHVSRRESGGSVFFIGILHEGTLGAPSKRCAYLDHFEKDNPPEVGMTTRERFREAEKQGQSPEQLLNLYLDGCISLLRKHFMGVIRGEKWIEVPFDWGGMK